MKDVVVVAVILLMALAAIMPLIAVAIGSAALLCGGMVWFVNWLDRQ